MAIVRCVNHRPEGRTESYVISLNPMGYPITAAVCGRHGCDEPGLVWLTEGERKNYITGTRVFAVKTNSMKVRVE